MLDAIQRARAERRLALKIAAILLAVVVLFYVLAGWVRGFRAKGPAQPAATEQVE